MQVKDLPEHAVFSARIGPNAYGLWRAGSSVLHEVPHYRGTRQIATRKARRLIALDVYAEPQDDLARQWIEWERSNPHAMHGMFEAVDFSPETEVTDYEGPLDIRIHVRGYVPRNERDRRRRKGERASTVQLTEKRPPKLDRGPRVIRLRDEPDAPDDWEEA